MQQGPPPLTSNMQGGPHIPNQPAAGPIVGQQPSDVRMQNHNNAPVPNNGEMPPVTMGMPRVRSNEEGIITNPIVQGSGNVGWGTSSTHYPPVGQSMNDDPKTVHLTGHYGQGPNSTVRSRDSRQQASQLAGSLGAISAAGRMRRAEDNSGLFQPQGASNNNVEQRVVRRPRDLGCCHCCSAVCTRERCCPQFFDCMEEQQHSDACCGMWSSLFSCLNHCCGLDSRQAELEMMQGVPMNPETSVLDHKKVEDTLSRYPTDAILRICVRRTDPLLPNVLLQHPLVKVHVVNLVTGRYWQRPPMARSGVHRLLQAQSKQQRSIQAMWTGCDNLEGKGQFVAEWNDNLVIKGITMRQLCDPKVLFLFEVVDFGPAVSLDQHPDGLYPICWGFLKFTQPVKRLPSAPGTASKRLRGGDINHGSLRLQLYRYARVRPQFTRPDTPDVYFEWVYQQNTLRRRYPSTLHVGLHGVRPDAATSKPKQQQQQAQQQQQQGQEPHATEQKATSDPRAPPSISLPNAESKHNDESIAEVRAQQLDSLSGPGYGFFSTQGGGNIENMLHDYLSGGNSVISHESRLDDDLATRLLIRMYGDQPSTGRDKPWSRQQCRVRRPGERSLPPTNTLYEISTQTSVEHDKNRTRPISTGGCSALCLNSDGTLIACAVAKHSPGSMGVGGVRGSNRGQNNNTMYCISIFETSSGACLYSWPGHHELVHDIAFSDAHFEMGGSENSLGARAGSAYIVTASGDHTSKVFDLKDMYVANQLWMPLSPLWSDGQVSNERAISQSAINAAQGAEGAGQKGQLGVQRYPAKGRGVAGGGAVINLQHVTYVYAARFHPVYKTRQHRRKLIFTGGFDGFIRGWVWDDPLAAEDDSNDATPQAHCVRVLCSFPVGRGIGVWGVSGVGAASRHMYINSLLFTPVSLSEDGQTRQGGELTLYVGTSAGTLLVFQESLVVLHGSNATLSTSDNAGSSLMDMWGGVGSGSPDPLSPRSRARRFNFRPGDDEKAGSDAYGISSPSALEGKEALIDNNGSGDEQAAWMSYQWEMDAQFDVHKTSYPFTYQAGARDATVTISPVTTVMQSQGNAPVKAIALPQLKLVERVSPPALTSEAEHARPIHQILYLRKPELLFLVSDESTVFRISVKRKQITQMYSTGTGKVGLYGGACVSGDGRILGVGGSDGKVYFYNVDTGKVMKIASMGFTHTANVVAAHPREQLYVMASFGSNGAPIVVQENDHRYRSHIRRWQSQSTRPSQPSSHSRPVLPTLASMTHVASPENSPSRMVGANGLPVLGSLSSPLQLSRPQVTQSSPLRNDSRFGVAVTEGTSVSVGATQVLTPVDSARSQVDDTATRFPALARYRQRKARQQRASQDKHFQTRMEKKMGGE